LAFPSAVPVHRSDEDETDHNLGREAPHGPRPGREQEEGSGEWRACDTDPGERLDDRTIGVREEAIQRRHRRVAVDAADRRCRRDVSDVLHGCAHGEIGGPRTWTLAYATSQSTDGSVSWARAAPGNARSPSRTEPMTATMTIDSGRIDSPPPLSGKGRVELLRILEPLQHKVPGRKA